MGKIFCVMGKSATGKDTIYKRILEEEFLGLKRIVPYTTRPIRDGEEEGKEYHFATEEDVQRLEKENLIIELRAYNTIHGIWKYFTVNDGSIELDKESYMLIGTLETYVKIRDYFGADRVIPIYIEVEDGERLARALKRERKPENQKYEEMCRRFLADSADFSEEKIKEAGVTKRFINDDRDGTLEEVKAYIESMM